LAKRVTRCKPANDYVLYYQGRPRFKQLLKQRIITAVILAVVALWALLGWNDLFFALFLLALTAGCAWEWGNLADVAPRNLRIAYAAIATTTTAICLLMTNSTMLSPLVLTGVIFWMTIVGDLFVRPVLPAETLADGTTQIRWPLLAIASFLLLLSVCCLYWLRQAHGPAIVIFTIALVAAADTGAYFSGRKFGRKKLAEQISGGKTIEGAAGGMLLALILSVVACRYVAGDGLSAWSVFIMSIFAALVSIAGDLFISRAKRTRDIKDSGTLLPGHGGVLDRFDGLLAAIPFIAFAALWM